MMKANLAAKLLPRLSKLNLQGVRINSCEPNGLLIVDKDVKFTISKQSSLSPPRFDTKCEVCFQTRISATKCDARVHELRVSAPKREVCVQPQAVPKREICVSLQECETRVQPKAAPEHDLRVLILKREGCVQQQTMSKRDLHISLYKGETRV